MISNWALKAVADGTLVLATADVRALLITDAHVPDRDDDAVSEVAAAELSGGNYARVTLAGKAVTRNDTLNVTVFTADAVTFTALAAAAGTPEYMVLFRHDTDDATSRIISYHLIRGAGDVVLQPNGENFIVPPHDDFGYGIFQDGSS